MTFTAIEKIFTRKYKGKKVNIRGWVYRKREGKDNIFLVVRDATNIIQTVIAKDSSAWATAEEATIDHQ
jgi:asparaginyl-tRNA synthetase